MEQNNGNDVDDVSVDSAGYDPQYLDEETLRLLKENDRYTDSLYVICNGDANANFRFDPLSIDWESDGTAISDNTSLRWIELKNIDQTDGRYEALDARDQRVRIRNAKALYRAVALNRSIRYLMIEGNIAIGLDMEDVVSILTPFVKESSKLCHFVLGGFDLSARTTQLLESALSSCTAKLKSFGLKRVTGITVTKMSKILDGIGKSSSIEELYLDENTISDEVATVLGDALPTLSSLKSLSMNGDYEMEHGRITAAGVEAIAEGLNNSSLESLSFWRNHIGTTGGMILAEALSSNTKLQDLDLTMALSPTWAEYILSKKGWELFFQYVQTSALTDLSLGASSIKDENIAAFVECLNGGSLASLNLWDLTEVSTSGWASFFSGLKRNTNLRTVKMHGFVNNMNDEVILPVLCDKSSIEGIYSSNHTLQKVEGSWNFFIPGRGSDCSHGPSECRRLLEMNKGTNKAEVARRKILEFHFRNGDENMQELVTLDVSLVPRVLEWFGRDGMRVGYQLIRSLPSLFSADALGRKRKRGE